MNRPKMDDYKIKVLHFETFEDAIDGRYVTDLEKYCDALEKALDWTICNACIYQEVECEESTNQYDCKHHKYMKEWIMKDE